MEERSAYIGPVAVTGSTALPVGIPQSSAGVSRGNHSVYLKRTRTGKGFSIGTKRQD